MILDDNLTEPQHNPKGIEANNQVSAWLFPNGFKLDTISVPAIVAAASRYQVQPPSVFIGHIQQDSGNWKLHRTKIPKVRAHLSKAEMLS